MVNIKGGWWEKVVANELIAAAVGLLDAASTLNYCKAFTLQMVVQKAVKYFNIF